MGGGKVRRNKKPTHQDTKQSNGGSNNSNNNNDDKQPQVAAALKPQQRQKQQQQHQQQQTDHTSPANYEKNTRELHVSTIVSERKKKKKKDKKAQSRNNSSAENNNMSSSFLTMPSEDKWSSFVLLVLYTLQGVPMGLCGSIPLLMKERGVTYEGLSLFSLVSFPFSLKLLWAPIVDSVFFKSFGRRKSWLIPIQLLTGLALYYGSFYVGMWLEGQIDVTSLTIFFFSLYFLMATQDIAVDGWALTMLSKDNVGFGSVCNTVGQASGVLLANQGFIALSDPGWCKRFLGYANGETFTNLPGFMRFWAFFFIIITAFVAFKTEKKDDEVPEGIVETYVHVKHILSKRPVQLLALTLLTCKMSFAAADSIFSYRLLDYGMPKTDSAMLSPVLMVISILLPGAISNVANKNPLNIFMKGVTFKILTSGLLWIVGQYAQLYYGSPSDHNSYLFFGVTFLVMILHEISSNLVFVSIMTFFNKVSDPAVGGTYMTLLNTLSNLGHKWPTSLALFMLPKVNSIACKSASVAVTAFEGPLFCSQLKDTACSKAGGVCETVTDGYTVLTIVCIVIGFLWMVFIRSSISKLQSISPNDWLLKSSESSLCAAKSAD